MRDRSTANECEMADTGMRREIVGSLRPTGEGLDDVRIEGAGGEGVSNNRDEVCGRPSSLFAVLDDDSVPCEDGADDGTEYIVKGITGEDAVRATIPQR